MRNLFWLVGLFATAVALALLMGQNGATVTLFWTPYRVDMSFNLVLAGVLGVFLLAYMALRSLALLRSLPRKAVEWRLLQRERSAHAGVLDALSNQLSGRYVRARGAANDVLTLLKAYPPKGSAALPQQAPLTAMAHLLAAEAAHNLQDHANRERHLDAVMQMAETADTSAVREGATLRAVRWALEDRNLEMANHWMGQLPQGAARRTVALRLRLRVAVLAQDHVAALDTARLLIKHKAYSAAASRSLLRGLLLSALGQCHDAGQVHALWKNLDKSFLADPELVLAAVTRLQAVSEGTADEQAALAGCQEWVLPVWERYAELPTVQRESLVRRLQALLTHPDAAWLQRVESLQRAYPADPALQYLAAQVFYREQLWGKAQVLFQQAIHGLADGPMLNQCWIRLAELAEKRGDEAAALAAWKAAARSAEKKPPSPV